MFLVFQTHLSGKYKTSSLLCTYKRGDGGGGIISNNQPFIQALTLVRSMREGLMGDTEAALLPTLP